MDENLRKSIIIENYNNPLNKGLVKDKGYFKTNINHLSCIDNLDFMIKIENDTIIDVRFDGEACAISSAATSIMIELILNKKINEVLNIIDNYEKMIDEQKYNDNLLGVANVFSNVGKQANRKMCALLPTEAIKKVIYEYKNKK